MIWDLITVFIVLCLIVAGLVYCACLYGKDYTEYKDEDWYRYK